MFPQLTALEGTRDDVVGELHLASNILHAILHPIGTSSEGVVVE